MRQQSHHYSIDAGPHLTAKEFRYLRILIVKTAIHQRFMTLRQSLDIKAPFILMALGKIQHLYNMLYIADACVLGKQLWLPILCHLQTCAYVLYLQKKVKLGRVIISNAFTF